MIYPKRRNGDEYYIQSKFLKGPDGWERYARDRFGNEHYPKTNAFAVRNNEKFYARDKLGNEFYPCSKGRSILIPGRLAKYSNGNQRYPTDKKGNEYYLQDEGKPCLLRQDDGSTYLAKNRKGVPMIPWNAMNVTDDRPYVCTKDPSGNVVYVHETDLPDYLKMICNCLCECVSHCPKLLKYLLS